MSKKLHLLISLSLTATFVSLFFYIVDTDDLYDLSTRVRGRELLLAFVLYLASLLARAIRWQILTPQASPKLRRQILVVLVHTMANNFLPARLGELAFPVLQKKYFGSAVAESFSALLLARFLDMIVLCLTFLACSFLVSHVIPTNNATSVVAGVSIVALICLVLLRQTIIGLLALARRFARSYLKMALPTIDTLHYHALQLSEKKRLRLALITTGVAFFLRFFSLWFMMLSVGSRVPVASSFWAMTFSDVTMVLPIHGFAGLGTMEGGWVLGFSLLGYDAKASLLTGTAVHLIFLGFSLLLGVFAYWTLETGRMRKQLGETKGMS